MNITSQLYDFLAGGCLYITIPVCIAGLIRKTVIIFSARQAGLRFPVSRTRRYIAEKVKGRADSDWFATFAGRDLFLAAVTLIFHVSVITAPLSAAGHWILLDLSWQIFPPVINPSLTAALTMMAIVCGVLLILRRVFTPYVRAVSSWRDYAVMTLVLVPFVTGLLAREFAGQYEFIMIIHLAGAHMLLVAIGWSRLGHFIFFTTGRIFFSASSGGVR